MTNGEKDVITEVMEEHLSESSTEEQDSSTSTAEDGVKNEDGDITITKADWDNTQIQIANLNKALKVERDKTKLEGLTTNEEKEDINKTSQKFEENYTKIRETEMAAERRENEAIAKAHITKRFGTLQADNDFGLDEQVVEAYQDLLDGRKKRGFPTHTQKAVSETLERAVKMVHPDLYVKELKRQEEEGTDYTGVGGARGMEPENKPRLNNKEKALTAAVDQMLSGRK